MGWRLSKILWPSQNIQTLIYQIAIVKQEKLKSYIGPLEYLKLFETILLSKKMKLKICFKWSFEANLPSLKQFW